MENKLTSTTDIYTVCTNESILTIEDSKVGVNIQPFKAICKLTKKQCALQMIGGWLNYAESFADIDELILTKGSFFMCFEGMTKVEISDPGQKDVKVGDAHKINSHESPNSYEKSKNTGWTLDNDGMINNDPDIVNNRIPALEKGPMGDVTDVMFHRTVTDDASSAFNGFEDGEGTHFLVDKNGKTYQTASLNEKTWHAGRKREWLKKNPNKSHSKNPSYYNEKSIGIEVVGQPLDKNGDITKGKYVKPKDRVAGKNYNPVVSWEDLTPKQEESVACLSKKVLNNYDLDENDLEVHEKIAPKTKGEGQTVYDAVIDDISRTKGGILVAVEGAVISCPNAMPSRPFLP